MATQSAVCARLDDTFGPHAANCRGNFDFTLLFEETILSILPLGILLIIGPPRIWYLFKKERKVVRSPLLSLKLVCIPSTIPVSELSSKPRFLSKRKELIFLFINSRSLWLHLERYSWPCLYFGSGHPQSRPEQQFPQP
jgi:hypothetical protein